MNVQIYLFLVAIVVSLAVGISIWATKTVIKEEYLEKVKSDISFDEMVQYEKRVSEFLQTNNLKPGDSIGKIADALKVRSGGTSNNINGRAQIFEPDASGNMIVIYNKKVPTSERLFDFAHECGHRINNDPVPANRPTGFNKPKAEQLADYIGAALLMPQTIVYQDLLESNYEMMSNRKRIAIIKKLSKKYNVSEMVAIRRVNEVLALKGAK